LSERNYEACFAKLVETLELSPDQSG
jgi:hypothetical protein